MLSKCVIYNIDEDKLDILRTDFTILYCRVYINYENIGNKCQSGKGENYLVRFCDIFKSL